MVNKIIETERGYGMSMYHMKKLVSNEKFNCLIPKRFYQQYLNKKSKIKSK